MTRRRLVMDPEAERAKLRAERVAGALRRLEVLEAAGSRVRADMPGGQTVVVHFGEFDEPENGVYLTVQDIRDAAAAIRELKALLAAPSTRDGRTVELEWGNDEMVVWTTGTPRELIGSFTFQHIEGASEDGHGDHYLITNMHLEGPNGRREYINQGIGREIVRIVSEILPVVFSSDDGMQSDNGSHLTDMGPGFARRMVCEKLASMGVSYDEDG